jgi:hypothetical protein
MAYTYDPIFAVDPANSENVAKNASITIFDPADPNQAPITITDPSGSPLPNPITVDAAGMGPAYQHPTLARVGWKGAGFTNYFTSYEGMFNETKAAKQAAEIAANEAATAASTTVTSAAVDGAGQLLLTKANGQTVDAGNVKGAPGVKGDKGDKGADGSNVVPTQQAIEQAIISDGPAKTALNATYASKAGIEIVAVGDGVADDSAAIRAALASAQPGQTVYGKPGAVYRIATAQTSTTFYVPSGTTTMPCGVVIPDGVWFDTRGATLLNGGVEMVLVTNEAAFTNASSHDVGGGLINAVLDGASFADKWLIQMAKLDGFQLDVEVKNAKLGGIQIYNATRLRSNYLRAENVMGQPFAIGYPTAALVVSDSTFGEISAENVSPYAPNTFNFPGNAFYGEMQRCTIDTMVAKNCAAGIKLAEKCVDLTIGKINMDTCGDAQGNSGVKFQGTNATSGPYRIHVGQITASNQWAFGLWMDYSQDCVVDSYVGYNNQTGGTGADVWIGGKRDQIGSMKSVNAGARAIYFRPYAADIHLGSVQVLNPGTVTTTANERSALVIAGGSGTILNFLATDDRATKLMWRGISVDDATAQVQIARARITGAVDQPYRVVSGATVGETLVAGTTTTAQIKLAAMASPITTGQALQTFLKAGTYNYTLPTTGVTTNNSLGIGTLRATPWFVSRAVTVSRIGAEITVAGDAGSVLRLGLYADDGTGYPGALVSGSEATIPSDVVGPAEATISATIQPGVYWAVGVVQGVTTTQPAVRVPANVMVSIGRTTMPTAGNAEICYTQANVTGALPATFTTAVATAGQAPRIFVKVA